jgi:hypothetical protein
MAAPPRLAARDRARISGRNKNLARAREQSAAKRHSIDTMAETNQLNLRRTVHLVGSSVAQVLPARRVIRNWVRGKILDTRLARDLPFADLRHDDKPVHRAEGYGGEPIEEFPPFRFYRLREVGRVGEAYDRYREWYREQFDRYRYMEKGVGGMKHGSLYRLVVALHEREQGPLTGSRPSFRDDLIDRAIQQRVEERFQLLNSIKQRGYERAPGDPVVGVARDGHVYLSSGHHRAAALRAIERRIVPDVLVLSPAARYLFRRLRIA